MQVEQALQIVYDLADQNALSATEVMYDAELQEDFELQHEALEIVQHYIDTDLGSLMGKYTVVQIGRALEYVYDLASDNVLDEDLTDGHEVLEQQRAQQLEAIDVIHDHIANHFGED